MARNRKAKMPVHSLQTIHSHAAGIDLGSRQHWVAGPPLEDNSPNVQSFGTTTPELFHLADWLKAQEVDTVAMESTGVYWIPLFEILASRGFDVILANARQVSHVPGRKTDMLDCQWIQLLHSCGLLRGSFRPADEICHLRSLMRERNGMLAQRSDWVRRMQKCLDQMNVCVHHAVSDITGATGMAMIRAIVNGESDPVRLAKMRDPRCRKSEQQIAAELNGNWRKDHLFNLRQALKMYDQLCQIIDEYDAQILVYVQSLPSAVEGDEPAPPPSSKSKASNIAKNGQEPMRQALYRLCGVDLTTIDGIGVDTAAVLLSEIGPDLSAFANEKHFVSYLRLAPNLSISGGKKVPNRSDATTSTRVANALRLSAITLRNSKSALGAYYRRIAARKGASVAVFATARKLAQLVYRLIRYGQAYVDVGAKAYEARYTDRRLKSYTKFLNDMGYTVSPMAAVEQTAT